VGCGFEFAHALTFTKIPGFAKSLNSFLKSTLQKDILKNLNCSLGKSY